MCVASRCHRQTADLRVLKSVTVVTAQRRCRVKNFNRVYRKRLERSEPDPGSEQIIRLRWDRETAALVNDVAHYARWFSYQVRQLGADTKEVPARGRDFDSRQNEKIVDRHTIKSHQPFLEQVIDRVTGVVIRDGDPA